MTPDELDKLLIKAHESPNGLPAPMRSKTAKEAFQLAFQLIGGVPRLALWAHANPTEFYRIYSKLIPQEQAVKVTTDTLNQLSDEELGRVIREAQGQTDRSGAGDVVPIRH